VNLNLCGGDPPDVVLFAGRTIFLPGLLGALERCAKKPITVVTGSDAEGVAGFSATTPASIIYVPLADPDELNGPPTPRTRATGRSWRTARSTTPASGHRTGATPGA
jgi:hypothetical protein